MKHARLFHMAPLVWGLCAIIFILSGVTWFFNPFISYIELGISAILLIVCLVYTIRHQQTIDRYMRSVLRHIDETNEQSLSASPLPILVITADQQILWHNAFFETQVMDGVSCKGRKIEDCFSTMDTKRLYSDPTFETDILGHHYIVRVSQLTVRNDDVFILYFLDVSELHRDAVEYAATRPVALLIQIDNLDQLMQEKRAGECAHIAAQVETIIEDWLNFTSGILRKYDDDRYIAIVEKRYLEAMTNERFSVLDRVRALAVDSGSPLTLSIGVGEGVDYAKAEAAAKQAMDMALGRGGDQAAVRTGNGFEFYGGVSKGVEKKTKVRTRIMASALQDLILSADNVLVMGHRFSDLDSVGSGLVLTSICRSLGKPAHLVVSRKTTLAEELFVRFERAGKEDLYIAPEKAITMIRPKTLLIVTDTQIKSLLESNHVYEAIHTVAVIDHHRKMVDHIDKAVLFYHESYASSACEMVTELVQYMNVPPIGALEAEALMSGIMLDSRNFVLKAGVRTFEAAAYLRKRGADTVSVKTIFSGSMESYLKKASIVSNATLYKQTAIACAEMGDTTSANMRIACSQAADELLSVKEIDAAFALFEDNGVINISARSYGQFNVQLVMEYLGGGGHLTMAGAQLKHITMTECIDKLKAAIDRYIQEHTSK